MHVSFSPVAHQQAVRWIKTKGLTANKKIEHLGLPRLHDLVTEHFRAGSNCVSSCRYLKDGSSLT